MAAAWIAIIAIAYATLTHVGFVYAIYFKLSPFLMRPAMQTYAHFEHVIAFAILGALFGFAYPRRTVPGLLHCVRRRGASGDPADHDAGPAWHIDRCAGENSGRRRWNCARQDSPNSQSQTKNRYRLVRRIIAPVDDVSI